MPTTAWFAVARFAIRRPSLARLVAMTLAATALVGAGRSHGAAGAAADAGRSATSPSADSLVAVSPSADSVGVELRRLIAQAHEPWARRPDFSRYVDVVARLYASRGDGPVWLEGRSLTPAGVRVVSELGAVAAQGLEPRDYDAATLTDLARTLPHPSWSAPALARLDLLLSVDLVRYLDDLRGGRIRPGPFGGRAPPGLDLARSVAGAVTADSVTGLVTGLQPALAQYRNLTAHLAHYRRLAAVPFAPLTAAVVKPGEPYPSADALRARLVALGDLLPDAPVDSAGTYDATLVAAVRRLQARLELPADGVLGPATFAALNLPDSVRVSQIGLAMERLRALPPLGRQRLLVVNIPAFGLFAFDSTGGTGQPALQMKVVIGKALDTRTPLLFKELQSVEFRPYWNVPRSILVKEILPALRRHPGWLRARQMELVDATGRVVGDQGTPTALARLASGALRVRQRPGPRNALGLVKFIFPNAAGVYLHDTPDTGLFALARRDLSHGCIRLEDAAGLATWVLQDLPGWSRPAVEAAMQADSGSRVLLARPMPVIVFYTTAVAAPDGTIRFYHDLYGHDRTLRRALRAAGEAA
jgi:murein L,D-transpeptidase YcbB/YkuD